MNVAAFFDVDETLISVKSMFDFLTFHLDGTIGSAGRAERVAAFRAAARDKQVPREQVNRVYYRIFAGERADTLAAVGRVWFELRRRERGFVHPHVVATLVRHRLAGHRIVLVSGSMPACLDPLAAALGADDVLCTRPLADDTGVLTGDIEASVIGAGKGTAVRALAAEHAISLPLSFGYADHSSDLPMLTLLGHPVVVGAEPDLVAHADRHGWMRFGKAAVA
ncbi:MAG: HAD-IB family hydrolase [Pseudonocardia sp.]|nr:HAD-IB family hydrolase [Pseudonocardia sp.]